ncbi:MAG: hypothetical protein LBQ10_06825 [Desulfovibrio sp.]|jgi:hypothetical protein|nr:hypothetical protein [Desulfovibrio sp.]
MANEFWKYGLAAGVGIVVGALGVTLLSRGGMDLKKAAAAILSCGMDMKDKAAVMVDTAKENIDDIAAEARYEQEQRKAAARS